MLHPQIEKLIKALNKTFSILFKIHVYITVGEMFVYT